MLANGTRLGPYEVLAPLGAGGMGEVWKARDTRLDREVALKLLPEEFARDRERRERFEREAKALAAVSHPNIADIHSFEETSGRYLLVQELLEGETLREALREGPLPPRKAVDCGAQIAEGLAAAHAKGIVHRDLKPENLFVTKEGRVKILDFGLAKQTAIPSSVASSSPTEAKATTPGTVLGTVGYMSPEQVRGLPADARSDLFALGCVLHEMLSGKKPFARETAAETMTAVLREDPPALEASPELSAIVLRCLEKKPEMRFQSARDLAFALRSLSSASEPPADRLPVTTRHPSLSWLFAGIAAFALVAVLIGLIRGGKPPAPPPSPSQPKRIVVLPFENLGSPEDGYFAGGITEEITSRLASVKSLAVISRTTATQYERKGKTVQQIGKDLGVGYVLEGSVRWDKSGGPPGRVRITPQLIRVADDTHLWTDRYDRQLADIFAIQGDVADGVVRALNLTLAPAESTTLRQLPTRDLEAYDLYLRALELERRNQEASALSDQIRLAGAAVERDPGFAEALALLARARVLNYWLFYDRRESELERARGEAERAVSLRPGSVEAHLALGEYYYQGRLDYEAALAEFRKALAIEPDHASVHFLNGSVFRRLGKMHEAEQEMRKAIETDPRNSVYHTDLGVTELLQRKYAEAVGSLEKAASVTSAFPDTYYHWAGGYLLWRGDIAAANHVLEVAAGVPGVWDQAGRLDLGSVRNAACARDWEAARRRVEAMRREAVTDQLQYIPVPLLRAEVLDGMGRRDAARVAYSEAARTLRAKASETPEDSRIHSSLGIALAALGQSAEAVREGERGLELMPVARDAVRGARRVEDLALIHAKVGNPEAAIERLDWLLSHPSWISVPLLRLDPRWDPLRKNPKFEALLARYESKP
ncbi:MAG TPA: protein kinase [Thermoanaerobaculia bacterium]|nr:protein kinase [Thermoanaerobaculia bacterium]HQR65883.1 protein kinase [Thermoanaerobaculia bacterium]